MDTIFFKNLLYLINHYPTDPVLQYEIARDGHYKGKLLEEYVGRVVGTDHDRYQEYLRGDMSPESISQLFKDFYNDPTNYRTIRQQAWSDHPWASSLSNQDFDQLKFVDRLPQEMQADVLQQVISRGTPNMNNALDKAWVAEVEEKAKKAEDAQKAKAAEEKRLREEKLKQQEDKIQQLKNQLAEANQAEGDSNSTSGGTTTAIAERETTVPEVFDQALKDSNLDPSQPGEIPQAFRDAFKEDDEKEEQAEKDRQEAAEMENLKEGEREGAGMSDLFEEAYQQREAEKKEKAEEEKRKAEQEKKREQQEKVEKLKQDLEEAEAEKQQLEEEGKEQPLSLKDEAKNLHSQYSRFEELRTTTRQRTKKYIINKINTGIKEGAYKGIGKTLGSGSEKKTRGFFGSLGKVGHRIAWVLNSGKRLKKYVKDKAKKAFFWLLRQLGSGMGWLLKWAVQGAKWLLSKLWNLIGSKIWNFISPYAQSLLARMPFVTTAGQAIASFVSRWVGGGPSWLGSALRGTSTGFRVLGNILMPERLLLNLAQNVGRYVWQQGGNLGSWLMSTGRPIVTQMWNSGMTWMNTTGRSAIQSGISQLGNAVSGLRASLPSLSTVAMYARTGVMAVAGVGAAVASGVASAMMAGIMTGFAAIAAVITGPIILGALIVIVVVGTLVIMANYTPPLVPPYVPSPVAISKGFVGVNIPSLVTQTPDKIDHVFKYLYNSCGASVVRVFYASDEIEDGLDKLQNLLKQAENNKIKLIITLANYGSDRTPERGNALIDIPLGGNPTGWYRDGYKGKYLAHVQNVVTTVKDSPAIYAWELANEPHCQADAACKEPYNNWVKVMSGAIRAWDPNTQHLISIGTKANDDINLGDSVNSGEYEANNSSAFISALTGHYYNGSTESRAFDSEEFQKQKNLMLQDLAVAQRLNKPFYIGEAGFLPNGDRATLLKTEMEEFFNKGAAGYLVWQYSDRANNSIDVDAFTVFEGDPVCAVMKNQAAKLIVQAPSAVNACMFTRSDQTPVAASYKSAKLSYYFEQAARISTVPAMVLAAIARIESPGVTNFTDEDVDNYKCIRSGPGKNVSDTGALGIMQVQPPVYLGGDPSAVSDRGIIKGAQFIDRPPAYLTEADFCNVKNSILMGAGVILDKMAIITNQPDIGIWDPKWNNDPDIINKLATGYYGCLKYPVCEKPSEGRVGGSHSYGADLYASIQSCQATVTNQPGGNSGNTSPIVPAGEGGAKIASAAEQIANQLLHSIDDTAKFKDKGIEYCVPGTADGGRNSQYIGYHCWAEMRDFNFKSLGDADKDYLQCTEFVWAAYKKAGFEDKIRLIYGGDAWSWANNARAHPDVFEVFINANELAPGDIISTGTEASAGHVVIVVRKERNRVLVAQSATDKVTLADGSVVQTKLEWWFIHDGKLIFTTPSRLQTSDSGFIRIK